MATVAGNTLQNVHLLIFVSQWQTFTSIVIGDGSLAMALRYWIDAGWVLLWVRRALSLVSPYLEMLDSDLKVSCLLLTQQAPTLRFNFVHWINDLWWNLLQGLLACNDWSLHCWFSRESLTSFKRLILMTYTTKVILPWLHWEVYWLAFLWRRGAVFIVKGVLTILDDGFRPHGPW